MPGDARHDPYQARGKHREPVRCATCGAIYRQGRWQWGESAPDAKKLRCPACQRIHDGLPAGRLVLGGPYLEAHRVEIMSLARHQEAQEKREHALHRIMDVVEGDGTLEITTTDIHLPRRIGEAIERAHDGELTMGFTEDDYGIAVRWHR